MPVEKLKEESAGDEAKAADEAKPDDAQESQTGKDAPSPTAAVEKPGLLSRFSSANKKKAGIQSPAGWASAPKLTLPQLGRMASAEQVQRRGGWSLQAYKWMDDKFFGHGLLPTFLTDDPFRFQGSGVDYKGKLIGIQEVGEARGDKMCQEAMQVAKALVKAAGQHKQRILLNISLQGIKLKDEKSGAELYQFPVSKISFIARDVTDARAFGFVYGTAESKHKFYAIKTAQTADHSVLAIRDMFHIVYEVKKKQLEEGKDRANSVAEGTGDSSASTQEAKAEAAGGIADLLCLEEEVAGLEQGMGNQDWATFEAAANGAAAAAPPPDFNKSDLFTSSTGSTAYPATDGDTSGDPFGGTFNTTVSSSNSGPLAASIGSANPYDALQGLDMGQPPSAATPVQAHFPAAPAAHDPFDTSHVNQMLAPAGQLLSTPVGPGPRELPSMSGMSSIRAPASLYSSSSLVNSSVFDTPPVPKDTWLTDDFPSALDRAGMSSLLDGPAPAGLEAAGLGGGEEVAATGPEAEANPLAGLTSPEGIDDALGKLTADLMGGTKKSPIPGMGSQPSDSDKLSPFDRLKKADKKPMGAMMSAAAGNGNGSAKAPLDIGQLYAQQPPPQQHGFGQQPQAYGQPQGAPMGMAGTMGGGGGVTNPFLGQGQAFQAQGLPPNMSAPSLAGNPFAGQQFPAAASQPSFAAPLGQSFGQPQPQQAYGQPQQNFGQPQGFPAAQQGFGGQATSAVRPRPAAVPAIGDPFNDPFFK